MRVTATQRIERIEAVPAADAGRLLRNLRRRRNLTQEELAAQIGTTQEVISRYERGQRSPPLAYLEQIFAALEVDLMIGFAPRKR